MILFYIFDDIPPISERNLFGDMRNFSLYFGTTLFALEAVGVVSRNTKKFTIHYLFEFFFKFILTNFFKIIALENNMKTPQNFRGTCGVLNIGMTVIVVLYIAIGFFGYVKYGPDAKGSITLNLTDDE